MKKMIMTLVLAIMAGTMAQAAAIKWGVSQSQAVLDWDANVQRGATVELIFIGNIGDTADEWVCQTRSTSTATGSTGGRLKADYVDPIMNIGQEILSSGQDLISGQSQFIIRIWTADAQWWIDTNPFTFVAANDITDVAFMAVSSTLPGGIDGNIDQVWGDQMNWNNVPEPTSFALLGLGVAALALRRRLK